jgi:hypothetical protein
MGEQRMEAYGTVRYKDGIGDEMAIREVVSRIDFSAKGDGVVG